MNTISLHTISIRYSTPYFKCFTKNERLQVKNETALRNLLFLQWFILAASFAESARLKIKLFARRAHNPHTDVL